MNHSVAPTRARVIEWVNAVLGVATADSADDRGRCEYFVPMQWLGTVLLDGAIRQEGFFGSEVADLLCQFDQRLT